MALEDLSVEAVQLYLAQFDTLSNQLRISNLYVELVEGDEV